MREYDGRATGLGCWRLVQAGYSAEIGKCDLSWLEPVKVSTSGWPTGSSQQKLRRLLSAGHLSLSRVIHPSALKSPGCRSGPRPARFRFRFRFWRRRHTITIGSRVLDPRERRVVGAACALWFGHRCLSRSMRLEEGMNLAHRQGNSFLGLFPGEYAHFRFRREHRALHRDG